LSDLVGTALKPPVRTGSEILAGSGSVFSKKLKAGKTTMKWRK
jgi:hypothetical protein